MTKEVVATGNAKNKLPSCLRIQSLQRPEGEHDSVKEHVINNCFTACRSRIQMMLLK
jgi:hypothetical protein